MDASIVSVRPVQIQDRQSLANLIHFEARVHRHLDWRPPLDWMGTHPYLVEEVEGDIRAVLVCPPDPPEIAWIRLFAVSSNANVEKSWQILWSAAQDQLAGNPNISIAAIPVEPWFQHLLEGHGFFKTHRVVALTWDVGTPLPKAAPIHLRTMDPDDLQLVTNIDRAAFEPLWRNSKDSLEIAYQQAAWATVAEQDDQIVGYQISTSGPMGGHLARLAVHPSWRGQGIGYALVRDALERFSKQGALRVSVNTQENNPASIALYRKVGFYLTGDGFPVYQLN